jgi:hypothetical protein
VEILSDNFSAPTALIFSKTSIFIKNNERMGAEEVSSL